MTAQQTADALIAEVNAKFARITAYDADDVPSPRPANYIEVGLSRRFGGNLKMAGAMGIVGYRVTVRAVSQDSVDNARNALEKARAALEFKRITVGDKRTTPIQFETEDPTEPDEGWFSGLHVFTFAI